MPGPWNTKDYLGYLQTYKTAGQTGAGPAIATVTGIPFFSVNTGEPDNNQYLPMANGSAGLELVVPGGRTPGAVITTDLMSQWFTYLNMNDWLGGAASYLDANYDSSTYSLNVYEPVLGSKILDGAHLQAIVIAYNAAGGGLSCQIVWPAVYGPGELASATGGSSPTFSAYSRVNGSVYGRKDVYVTGFDQDRSWVLTLMRDQTRQFFNQATGGTSILNAAGMTTGMIVGTLGLEQSRTYSTTPSSTVTIQIGPATTGVKFLLYVNRDNVTNTWQVPGAGGSQIRAYSLADINNANSTSPGYPLVISAGV